MKHSVHTTNITLYTHPKCLSQEETATEQVWSCGDSRRCTADSDKSGCEEIQKVQPSQKKSFIKRKSSSFCTKSQNTRCQSPPRKSMGFLSNEKTHKEDHCYNYGKYSPACEKQTLSLNISANEYVTEVFINEEENENIMIEIQQPDGTVLCVSSPVRHNSGGNTSFRISSSISANGHTQVVNVRRSENHQPRIVEESRLVSFIKRYQNKVLWFKIVLSFTIFLTNFVMLCSGNSNFKAEVRDNLIANLVLYFLYMGCLARETRRYGTRGIQVRSKARSVVPEERRFSELRARKNKWARLAKVLNLTSKLHIFAKICLIALLVYSFQCVAIFPLENMLIFNITMNILNLLAMLSLILVILAGILVGIVLLVCGILILCALFVVYFILYTVLCGWVFYGTRGMVTPSFIIQILSNYIYGQSEVQQREEDDMILRRAKVNRYTHEMREVYKASEMSHKECNVCLNSFIRTDEVVVLECEHVYHEKCIKQWFMEQLSCPVCRKIIDLDIMHRPEDIEVIVFDQVQEAKELSE